MLSQLKRGETSALGAKRSETETQRILLSVLEAWRGRGVDATVSLNHSILC